MEDLSWLETIRGYLDLGMLDEAWREIERLPADKSSSPEAQEMRIIVQLDRGNLDEALALSEVLCDLHPDKHAGFIQGAWCFHAMGRTEEAIEHLQSGPDSLRHEPVYFYNLACYEVALGRTQAAVTWLKQSFEMDDDCRRKAREDPDLAAVRGRLEASDED